jgi:hypothetical protein
MVSGGRIVTEELPRRVRRLGFTVQVGNAFPLNDPRSAVALVFIMASRECMAKALAASQRSGTCEEHEQLAIHGMIGAAKEAMDAFRVADNLACFKRVGNVEKDLELARRETDAALRGSLYQVVQRVRNQAAYHWDRDRIQAALTELQGDILPLNPDSCDATAPIIGLITSKILETFAITEPGIFPRLSELAEALGRLGLALYAHQIRYRSENRPHEGRGRAAAAGRGRSLWQGG